MKQCDVYQDYIPVHVASLLSISELIYMYFIEYTIICALLTLLQVLHNLVTGVAVWPRPLYFFLSVMQ